MTDKTLDCVVLGASPTPFILPKACIAEWNSDAQIEAINDDKVEWMVGHVNWNDQRIPLIDIQSLIYGKKIKNKKMWFVVLNPIANAARRSYTALLCPSKPKEIELSSDVIYSESELKSDKRYVDAMLSWQDKEYVLPKLSSLSVAFTYI